MVHVHQALQGGWERSTDGIFELKETEVQAGKGVSVEILSGEGFFLLPEKDLDTIAADIVEIQVLG